MRTPWLFRPQLIIAVIFIGLMAGGLSMHFMQERPVLAKKDGTPKVLSARPPLFPPVDCMAVPCMALTFDDGPNPTYTPQLLDLLQRYRVRATFFIMGKHVPGNEALLKRMYLEGHEIGNHSWDHPDFTRLSPEQIEAQVSSTQGVIAATGVPLPTLFRPPYGEYNPMVEAHVPLSIIRWDVDPSDWRPSMQPSVAAHVVAHAHSGAIVLMHDTETTTLPAVEPIIQQLQAQGYQLVTVSDILDLPPGQRGVYFHRSR